MQDRVSVLTGSEPFLIVAPHGHDLDDTNTGLLAETITGLVDGYLVANNGWRRSKQVDELNGLANCNDRDHVQADVVRDEFYVPIETAVGAITENPDPFEFPLVLMIHGIGNRVRKDVGEPKLDVIVGWGNGDKPRPTCEKERREFFVDLLAQSGMGVFEGKAGGGYSAHSLKNLTQVVHREYGVDVLQLEFIMHRREKAEINTTAKHVAAVLKGLVNKPVGYVRKKAVKEV